MALKAKTKARFELSSLSYLLDPVFLASFGPIEAVLAQKASVPQKRGKPEKSSVRLPAPPQ